MIKIRDLYNQVPASTDSGEVCLYERGGSYTNTGLARVIGDKHGNPKEAVHVRTKGDLACGDHAAIPVEAGDYIIQAERHRDNITVSVGIVTGVADGLVNIRGASEDINLVEGLTAMVDAAIAKVYDCHCRRPYYIRNN